MAKGDAFWRIQKKKAALEQAETSGRVADSMEVRKVLMARFDSGEITLEQAQAELSKIKRGANKAGMVTRAQVFRAG